MSAAVMEMPPTSPSDRLRTALACVEHELQRAGQELERLRALALASATVEQGAWRLEAGELRCPGGVRLRLTATQSRLLELLLAAGGRVVSRDVLTRALYGSRSTERQIRNADTHVKRLRERLEGGGIAGDAIETVHGFGYRWAGSEACQ